MKSCHPSCGQDLNLTTATVSVLVRTVPWERELTTNRTILTWMGQVLQPTSAHKSKAVYCSGNFPPVLHTLSWRLVSGPVYKVQCVNTCRATLNRVLHCPFRKETTLWQSFPCLAWRHCTVLQRGALSTADNVPCHWNFRTSKCLPNIVVCRMRALWATTDLSEGYSFWSDWPKKFGSGVLV